MPNPLRKYFTFLYSFIVESGLPYGPSYFFPIVFLATLFLPVHLIALFVMDKEPFMFLVLTLFMTTLAAGYLLHLFPSFDKWLSRQFAQKYYKKQQLGFWYEIKGHGLIALSLFYPFLFLVEVPDL